VQKKSKKSGVPDQGTPLNSHATTTTFAATPSRAFQFNHVQYLTSLHLNEG
jgi:hypothetical protein